MDKDSKSPEKKTSLKSSDSKDVKSSKSEKGEKKTPEIKSRDKSKDLDRQPASYFLKKDDDDEGSIADQLLGRKKKPIHTESDVLAAPEMPEATLAIKETDAEIEFSDLSN